MAAAPPQKLWNVKTSVNSLLIGLKLFVVSLYVSWCRSRLQFTIETNYMIDLCMDIHIFNGKWIISEVKLEVDNVDEDWYVIDSLGPSLVSQEVPFMIIFINMYVFRTYLELILKPVINVVCWQVGLLIYRYILGSIIEFP